MLIVIGYTNSHELPSLYRHYISSTAFTSVVQYSAICLPHPLFPTAGRRAGARPAGEAAWKKMADGEGVEAVLRRVPITLTHVQYVEGEHTDR